MTCSSYTYRFPVPVYMATRLFWTSAARTIAVCYHFITQHKTFVSLSKTLAHFSSRCLARLLHFSHPRNPQIITGATENAWVYQQSYNAHACLHSMILTRTTTPSSQVFSVLLLYWQLVNETRTRSTPRRLTEEVH